MKKWINPPKFSKLKKRINQSLKFVNLYLLEVLLILFTQFLTFSLLIFHFFNWLILIIIHCCILPRFIREFIKQFSSYACENELSGKICAHEAKHQIHSVSESADITNEIKDLDRWSHVHLFGFWKFEIQLKYCLYWCCIKACII